MSLVVVSPCVFHVGNVFTVLNAYGRMQYCGTYCGFCGAYYVYLCRPLFLYSVHQFLASHANAVWATILERCWGIRSRTEFGASTKAIHIIKDIRKIL